jgi:two-component system, LytTR family, response regulator LytT
MRCIIIEDETGARKHLERQLKLSGFDVEIIERLDTVRSAINWLRHNTIDIIFLDLRLGDGNSLEIFDNIRVKTPVIFTTAYNWQTIHSLEINTIAYLLKPVKRKELINALEKKKLLYPPLSMSKED